MKWIYSLHFSSGLVLVTHMYRFTSSPWPVKCTKLIISVQKKGNFCVNLHQLHPKDHVIQWWNREIHSACPKCVKSIRIRFFRNKFSVCENISGARILLEIFFNDSRQLLLLFLLSSFLLYTFKLLLEWMCSAQVFIFYYPWDTCEAQSENRLSYL